VALVQSYDFLPSGESESSPVFEEALAKDCRQLCGQSLRQASRFASLAAVGALSCAKRAQLPCTSGLYLATGLGDLNSAARLFAQTRLGVGLSPYDFINVNNNTAAYYIARIGGFTGPNLTISQGAFSFEWALYLAQAAMVQGLTHALVGGVDERAPSRVELVRRVRAHAQKRPGEGSGWLALTTERRHAEGVLLGLYWLGPGLPEACPRLKQLLNDAAASQSLHVMLGAGAPKDGLGAILDTSQVARIWSYHDVCGDYPTAQAAGLALGVAWASSAPGVWVHISGNGCGAFAVIVWESCAPVG